MSFSFDTWGTAGGQSRAGQSFQIFTYKTNDTLAEITTAGYFNANKGNLRKNDLIIIHREDIDGQNALDFTIRITSIPVSGDVSVVISQSDDWSDDGSKIYPTIDGRDVSTGSGDLITNDATFNALDASKIVHTDGDKKLVSVNINTAYNKNFKTDTPAADTDAGDPGNSTDIPKGNHSHPKTQATETVIGQSARANQAETNATLDQNDTKHITPLKLANRTATELRTGIAELATQPETDAEIDDTRIVTPLKLAGKKASQAEAEAAADNTKIMTPLRTKQFSFYNLALKRVIISNNITDPNNDIDFASGRMWNNARTKLLNLPAFIKQLDASFAAGTNQGMLGQGLSKTSNTWYYLFGIEKDSDGSTDYYADTSFAAANIPTGYSNPAFICDIKTDGSGNIYSLNQVNENVEWLTRHISLETTTPSTSRTAVSLDVPPRILKAKFEVGLDDTGEIAVLFSGNGYEDVAPLEGGSNTQARTRNAKLTGDGDHIQFERFTNSSGQIYYRFSQATANAFVINSLGWELPEL